MSLFDLILAIVVFGFVLSGFWFGVIHALGAVVGLVLGAYVAGQWYEGWAQALAWLFYGHDNVARIVIFMAIFTLVNRLVGLVFYILERIFKIISVVPFLKTINRLAGAALGFIEGVVVVGAALYLTSKYQFPDWYTKSLA
ncbi:CvpA family protein, partial [Candidatus Uhrbacteria bacterium]|nr:CvpA family protein [Candidatus Uhrbacteria bacterium]